MTRNDGHGILRCLGLLLWLLVVARWASAEEPVPAFAPGERLTYEIRWMFIPAGAAILEVAPHSRVERQPACHFIMSVRTNSFVDVFYKVRDRIEAWTDLGVTRSLRYQKLQRQGAHRQRDVSVVFDWKRNQATYSDRGRFQAPADLMDGTLDPLAAFYFTRTMPLIPGTAVERPVTDGKKTVIGRARVVGRERIQVPAGTFDTVLVEPDLSEVKGVFEKSPGARIKLWLTDDGRHIPVRIRSQVVVGHFSGELVAAEGISEWPSQNAAH